MYFWSDLKQTETIGFHMIDVELTDENINLIIITFTVIQTKTTLANFTPINNSLSETTLYRQNTPYQPINLKVIYFSRWFSTQPIFQLIWKLPRVVILRPPDPAIS